MLTPITLENDYVSAKVWPGYGGKVSSIVDRSDRQELLFTYPSELPTSPVYDIPYGNGWYAGWDECFPSVAPSPYVGKPYDGIAVPDHGEVWGLTTQSVPVGNGLRTVWHGLRFGYRLERELVLDGPSVRAEYTLQNRAPIEFRFVWAQHALLAMVEGMELDLPGIDLRLSHDAKGEERQRPLGDVDPEAAAGFARPSSLPAGRGWKVFSTESIRTPIRVVYPSRRRALRIRYESPDQLPAYWGIWINTGGWAGHRHLAVEPTTGRHDQIDRAARDGSAGLVESGATVRWTTVWTLESA